MSAISFHGLADHRYSLKPRPYAAAQSSAYRLISVDSVQVLLFAHCGTFAVMRCHSVAGMDFPISRTKYREPILYAAFRSQL